jgi:hypothetical protein
LNNTRTPVAAKRLRPHLAWLAALALGAILVACGGGTEGNGDGGNSRPIAPAGDPAAQQPGGVNGRILSAIDGSPIVGATVTAGGTSTTTAADGSFTITGLTAAERVPVTVAAPGYASTTRITTVTGGVSIRLPTQLLPVSATTMLNVAAGSTVTVPGSAAQVIFPPNAIVDAAGAAPAQSVSALVTPINPAQDPNLMPGDYRTTDAGASALIESFGAVSVVLADAVGGTYNLATGLSATIRIPASSRASTLPATVPLYWFDEATSLWVLEGTATLGGTAPNQYYEGSVTRTAVWSASQLISTVLVTGCVQDLDGLQVVGARIEADGVTYSGMSSAVTNSRGMFSIPVRRDATVVLTARSGSLLSNARAATTAAVNVSMGGGCLNFGAVMQMKLTWGQAPRDVDSHLLTPHGAHIDYTNKGSLSGAPYANLDIDDTTSFGPEFVTIRRLAQGTYRYYLDNYSETFNPGMTDSQVKVELRYDGNTTVYTPGPGEGSFLKWHAFDIVVDSQCGVTIVPADTWLATGPANPNPAGAVTYCNN